MINYETTETQLQQQLPIMKRQSFMYAMMRISAIVLFLLFLWIGRYGTILYAMAFLFLLLFLLLVYAHEKLKETILTKETKLEMIDKLKRRHSAAWKQEFKEPWISDDAIINDLDICGKASLLSYIGMAETPYGKDYLLSLFEKGSDMEAIRKRQSASKELLQNPEELLNLQTYSALFSKHSKKVNRDVLGQLVEHAGTELKTSPIVMGIHKIMTILTLCMLAGAVLWPQLIDYVWICISLNIIMVLAAFMHNNEHLHEVAMVKDILEDYYHIMKEIDSLQVQDSYLLALQSDNRNALIGIRKLLQISQLTKARSNFLTNLFFNGLCQLDFHCIRLLSNWKHMYGTHMQSWFQTIAEVEALSSLCVIAQVKETYCFPDMAEESTPLISFENSYHPLIEETSSVANSLHIKNETYIITGSNMSGKTTFLRTIGINSKLALAGGPVCAKQYQMSLLDIYTSMRVQDDVSEGISTFYAELLSIKKMMDAAKRQAPMLVLIDEIFKGTNSADRITCAKEAICRLHKPWIITMVSTHDFELCGLEEDAAIHAHNYHFEETYQNDKIQFDYQLKKGKCTTTNAKELMKLAGF